ncbi:MAG: DNA replication and repair protein RecF [Candidatus Peribacteraceae bacterium]|nr:DNA replication and repair protein RecF [Candidatus Peribacteraceae bacterium]
MQVLRLQLTHFRNYASLDADVSGALLHLFLGRNGSGKTNLLDALSVLSVQRSFLGLEEQDLTRHGADFHRLRATVRSDAGEEETLETVSQQQPRKQRACFRNDVRIPVSEMVGRLPTVAFLPSDLELFVGPPAGRRRFLDQILSQAAPSYHRAFGEYHRALKQRNTLLRRVADRAASARDLDPWDAHLAEKGSILTVARLELVETFSLALTDELKRLGESWSETVIRYERSGTERTSDALAAELRALLGRARERDLLLQSTTVGPHRDDWRIEADGTALERHASRGQQRAAVLSLLFLEASYLELCRNENPVILLDDVFSELDDDHQERVLGAFPGHQVFLTATHRPPALHDAAVWLVDRGTAVRE